MLPTPAKAYLAMFGVILVSQLRLLLTSSGWRPGILLTSYNAQDSPIAKMTWPQVSPVLRLRNPGLDSNKLSAVKRGKKREAQRFGLVEKSLRGFLWKGREKVACEVGRCVCECAMLNHRT